MGGGGGKWEDGGVCSLASFKGHFQTIAQNDRGKHGGVRGKGERGWTVRWAGGEWGRVDAQNNHTHSHLRHQSLHLHIPPTPPPQVRQLIAVKTCLIESFQANPQAWAFVGPLLVNIH